MRIGLTGGIASGKSTVARELERLGAVIIDADVLARDVVALGTEGLKAVVARFGDAVLAADGSLDRRALAGIVFADPQARADLNAIIHPRVRERAAELEAAISPMRGRIRQVPSTVSAIKVGGKRAYALARAGAEVSLSARDVEITRLDVLAMRPGDGILDVDVDVECSSGTYVRAIARDLGQALGTGGHLTALRRTRIGGYGLDQAVRLGEEPPRLMPMADAARLSFPCVLVDAAQARDVGFGRTLHIDLEAEPVGIIGPGGELLALYRPGDGGARPLAVLS